MSKNDPRDEKCSVNKWQKHKWARSFKDAISKSRFIQILRCRYCARYVCVEFNRVVLPSGRVTVTERAFETLKGETLEAVTQELRSDDGIGEALKHIEKTAHSALHP